MIPPPVRSPRRSAFTLAETLVVVAIMGMLAALILPAIAKAIARAGLAKCAGTLGQWGTGFQLYMADHDGFLPTAAATADASSQWQEQIAPYLMGNRGTAGNQRALMRTAYGCPGRGTKGIVYGGNLYLIPTKYAKAPLKLSTLAQKLHSFMLLGEDYTGDLWDTAPWSGGTGVDYQRHAGTGQATANFLFADFHVESLTYRQTLDMPVVSKP